jgi:hypothetical protein
LANGRGGSAKVGPLKEIAGMPVETFVDSTGLRRIS